MGKIQVTWQYIGRGGAEVGLKWAGFIVAARSLKDQYYLISWELVRHAESQLSFRFIESEPTFLTKALADLAFQVAQW